MAPAPAHILIIDDNEDMLVMLAIQLREKGYKVTARRSFDSFEEEIVEMQPGLVLIDKNLGWADGLNLCAMMKKNVLLNNVRVIIFSAYPLTAAECEASGVDAFFEKPNGMTAFLESIDIFIGKN